MLKIYLILITVYVMLVKGKSYKKSIWLYDSDAGEHITNNKVLLINFKK